MMAPFQPDHMVKNSASGHDWFSYIINNELYSNIELSRYIKSWFLQVRNMYLSNDEIQ